jgi:hypothetical protein
MDDVSRQWQQGLGVTLRLLEVVKEHAHSSPAHRAVVPTCHGPSCLVIMFSYVRFSSVQSMCPVSRACLDL